jgi:hypothetical protein
VGMSSLALTYDQGEGSLCCPSLHAAQEHEGGRALARTIEELVQAV